MSNDKQMNNKVYILYHTYQIENQDDEWKLLGVYTSIIECEKAIDRYHKLEGFSKTCRDCFTKVEYILNKDSEWTEGFVSVCLD